jgi:protein-S-isoprenylcysteine O-methyltransferase Ste14
MTALFPSVFEEAIFWVIILSGDVLNQLFERRSGRKFKKTQKAAGDKRTTFVIQAVGLSSFVVALWIGYTRIAVLPNWLFYPGLATYILGLAFGSWAAFTLGRFFSPYVGVQADHRLIDKGPYRLIRHPRYAGGLLIMFGLGLALQSWAAVLVLVIGSGLGYAYRIRVEEKFMIAHLGNEYVEYCKRTKRIIPFIF